MEEKIIIWLQSGSSHFLDIFFSAISYLASWIGAIFLLSVILLFVNKKFGLTFGLGMLATIGFNYILKTIIARPRPYLANPEIVNKLSTVGASFPSGHSVSVIFMMLSLLYLIKLLQSKPNFKYLKKTWVRVLFYIFACVLVVLTALSRMYLGQHYLSDIIGGLLIGTLGFLSTLFIYKKIARI